MHNFHDLRRFSKLFFSSKVLQNSFFSPIWQTHKYVFWKFSSIYVFLFLRQHFRSTCYRCHKVRLLQSSFEGNTSESANYCSREIFQQKSRSEDQCSWRKMPHYGINFLDWKQFWNVKPMEKGKPLEIRAQRVAPTKIRFLPTTPDSDY